MTLGARTFRVDADTDPFAVGRRSGLLWSHGDFTIAGVGEARRVPVSRPHGSARAAAMLAEIEVDDPFGDPGTGAVAFAAFPFDREAKGEVIVPEIVVGRGLHGDRWVTTISDGPLSRDDALDRVATVVESGAASTRDPGSFELTSVIPAERWRDEIVGGAIGRISQGELRKAVLARELRLTTDQPIDSAAVLDRLKRTYRSAILYSVDRFLGASPELLVSRHRDLVRAHPLAGTAPRSSDPEADQRLAADLLASTKNGNEHRITIDWLLDTLLPFCSYVDAEPEPSIVSLANVHHLGTRVEGRLSDPAASILELVAALHPTPAVGGDPQAGALALIDELEGADRGRYAGPVGWLDSLGNGAFAVGLRGAQLTERGASIFAGVGVVADSDPQSELDETRNKFQTMLGALIAP